MRRALGLAFLGLALGGTLRAQTVTAAVGGELTGQRYNTVLVPIAVDMSAAGGEKLGSYTARITWDPTTLQFNAALAGNFPLPQVNTDSVGYGILKFTSISPVGASGLVTIAQLQYSVADTLGSPLTLSFSEMSAAGTYTNLLPGLVVTSATFCPSRGLWGDIDRDGASNSRDALLILSKVVGLPVDTTVDTVSTQPLVVDTLFFDSGLGDVNADGAVTSVDALIILSTAVGIPIPGQRVLVLAPGGCGTGSPKTMAVFPSTAQLAPGQDYQLLAQGRDTAGRVVTLSNATWRSSNLTVASVDADGTVHPRAPGTAVITAAVGPGISATATVTVAPRSKWYVNVSVTGAQVQFGTPALPFDNPLRAFSVVHEGDTIAVAPGTYDFADYGIVKVGVVIQGGTLGDTTTRPLFRDAQAGYHTALELEGGLRTVVQNVAFRNFNYAVDLQGVRSFALEDSKVEVTSGNYGTGIYTCANTLDTVRVDRSVFRGDSSGTALENDYCVQRTALVMVRDTKISGWSDGISWPDADSMVIVRSDVSDNDGYGVYVTQEYNVNPSLYVAHSRIARNYSTQVYGYPLRRAVFDSSSIEAPGSEGINLQGACSSCGGPMQTAFHGDTITIGPNATEYYWIQVSAADTFLMDRTVVQFPDTTPVYAYSSIQANDGIVTRSQFLHVGNGNLFDFTGLRLFVDSVTMTACAVANCDQATGFNPSSGEGGPQLEALTLQRSHFTQIGYPVYGNFPGTATISNNVIDSTQWGVELYVDSAIVTNNVLTRVVSEGLYVFAYGGAGQLADVGQNSVNCSPAGARAIDVSAFPTVTEDNLVTGCFVGIYAQRSLPGSVLRRNTIRGGNDGITVDQFDTITVRVDSNGVSGAADAAVTRVQGGRLTMTNNNISGNAYGVFFAFPYWGAMTHELHGNSFTGNTQYAIVDTSASDSVNAESNYWNSASGSGGGVGDSVLGHVDTTNSLPAAPGGLPGLAPRFLATAALVHATAGRPTAAPSAPKHVRLAAAPRPARSPAPRPARSLTFPARMPAKTVAMIEEQERRRAEHAARDAARRSTRP